ncbi:MAG: phosphatase PAP2 family protein [Myxococcales bacterium]
MNMRGIPSLRPDTMSFPILSRAAVRSGQIRFDPESVWWQRHLWLPLLAFALLSAWLFGGGDMRIADRLYAWQGGRWAWQDAWAARRLLHDGGVRLCGLLWLTALFGWAASLRGPALRAWRWPLGYVLLAVLASLLLIPVLKAHTDMDCPYDLLRYGGKRAYHGLFEHNPNSARGRCFPAGNASAGYAWLCLYFMCLHARPKLRWFGLGFAIAFGAVLGVNQQLRGQHFLAHDLWTATICWLLALGLYAAMLRGRAQGGAA